MTVGTQQGGYAQIASGLQPGEKIVVEGSLFLTNAANMQD